MCETSTCELVYLVIPWGEGSGEGEGKMMLPCDMMGGTIVLGGGGERKSRANLPYEMFPIRHSPHGTHGTTDTGKPESAAWLSQALVQAVLVHGAVSPAGVDEVAVG